MYASQKWTKWTESGSVLRTGKQARRLHLAKNVTIWNKRALCAARAGFDDTKHYWRGRSKPDAAFVPLTRPDTTKCVRIQCGNVHFRPHISGLHIQSHVSRKSRARNFSSPSRSSRCCARIFPRDWQFALKCCYTQLLSSFSTWKKRAKCEKLRVYTHVTK